MINNSYLEPKIKELSKKLQSDVNVILENYLTYLEDGETREGFHAHLDVDIVLKSKIPAHRGHKAIHGKHSHTHAVPRQIDALMNPIQPHSHVHYTHKDNSSLLKKVGRVTQSILGIA